MIWPPSCSAFWIIFGCSPGCWQKKKISSTWITESRSRSCRRSTTSFWKASGDRQTGYGYCRCEGMAKWIKKTGYPKNTGLGKGKMKTQNPFGPAWGDSSWPMSIYVPILWCSVWLRFIQQPSWIELAELATVPETPDPGADLLLVVFFLWSWCFFLQAFTKMAMSHNSAQMPPVVWSSQSSESHKPRWTAGSTPTRPGRYLLLNESASLVFKGFLIESSPGHQGFCPTNKQQ